MKLKSEQESYRNAQAGAQPVRESHEAPMPGAKMPASVSPNVQDMPLVFDKPRRHFGCGLWFLILILITVIGGTILTPVLLKLVFRSEKETQAQQTRLIDHYDKMRQLDLVSEQLLDRDRALMDQGEEQQERK